MELCAARYDSISTSEIAQSCPIISSVIVLRQLYPAMDFLWCLQFSFAESYLFQLLIQCWYLSGCGDVWCAVSEFSLLSELCSLTASKLQFTLWKRKGGRAGLVGNPHCSACDGCSDTVRQIPSSAETRVRVCNTKPMKEVINHNICFCFVLWSVGVQCLFVSLLFTAFMKPGQTGWNCWRN